MASETTNAIEKCKKCIDESKSFILQGGAGSGKTESLKEILLYIKKNHTNARVICITHTNAAVDEIVKRVGDRYPISTIHAFLHGLIGNYKKNIKEVIAELFFVPQMIRSEQNEKVLEKDYKKAEYDKYKEIYEKYASKFYIICKENTDKVIGKKEYDKNPIRYNKILNDKIDKLNDKITGIISKKDYSKIHYNETNFDSMNDVSYGHDGLLTIFHLLFNKFPLLGKIIADRYDYLFIDEYQDTRTEVLKDLLTLPTKYGLTIGLFGDSMQSIYEKRVGNVNAYIDESVLIAVPKADNYRCSYEVIEVINQLRLDKILQDVALKKIDNGEYEKEIDRHGLVKVLYSVVDQKPNAFSLPEEKEKFQAIIDGLINEAKKVVENPKILVLTNKAIAEKNGFKKLYKVFDDRYSDVSDRMEKYLNSILVMDVGELCNLYLKKEYNLLIKHIRKGGYTISSVSDKKRLHDIMQNIIDNKNLSIQEVIEIAITNKLIKPTETYKNKLKSNANFLEQLKNDHRYQEFKKLYLMGQKTFNQIKDNISFESKEEFSKYESIWKQERFIQEIFSDELKFDEILNYTKYLNEETEYITMHKTKGTSITSVIVVMEEYFWNKYDFSLLYLPQDESKMEKKINSQKLIYVACSRARKNLVCVKVLTSNEVEPFLQLFPNAELVDQVI